MTIEIRIIIGISIIKITIGIRLTLRIRITIGITSGALVEKRDRQRQIWKALKVFFAHDTERRTRKNETKESLVAK
jgi:hypothetical protein